MDVKQLNYFVQIAKYGSYSLASQKLYISQPALSKVIKNMEEEMGFTFFYTYQRKQKLTDAGQAFYEKAVRLIENYNDLIQTKKHPLNSLCRDYLKRYFNEWGQMAFLLR